MNMTTRFKKAIAAGLIGVTALGATAAVPALASAQAPGDGTELTQEEREARRAERRAAREARRAEKVAVLTDALGVGEDVLQAAREAGQSIADVADANGVSVDSVVTALVDHKAAQIQARVDAGDLTQEEANEKIAGLAERVTERVNATPGERGDGEGRGFGRRGPGGPGGGNAEPASA